MGQYGPTVPRRRRISTRRLLLADLSGGGFAHSWMRGVRILESVCRLAGAGAGWTGGGVADDRRRSSDAVSTLPHASSPARILYSVALAALLPCRSDGARIPAFGRTGQQSWHGSARISESGNCWASA